VMTLYAGLRWARVRGRLALAALVRHALVGLLAAGPARACLPLPAARYAGDLRLSARPAGPAYPGARIGGAWRPCRSGLAGWLCRMRRYDASGRQPPVAGGTL
jgi:hypothetical protein